MCSFCRKAPENAHKPPSTNPPHDLRSRTKCRLLEAVQPSHPFIAPCPAAIHSTAPSSLVTQHAVDVPKPCIFIRPIYCHFQGTRGPRSPGYPRKTAHGRLRSIRRTLCDACIGLHPSRDPGEATPREGWMFINFLISKSLHSISSIRKFGFS